MVVLGFERLGRSLKQLVETVTNLDHRDIGFKSLTEAINTTTPGGNLVFHVHVFAALAEFERDLIRERTNTGLAAACDRVGGRPKKLDAKKISMAMQLHADNSNDFNTICQTLGSSKATLYLAVKHDSN